jgi:hypothetical protein
MRTSFVRLIAAQHQQRDRRARPGAAEEPFPVERGQRPRRRHQPVGGGAVVDRLDRAERLLSELVVLELLGEPAQLVDGRLASPPLHGTRQRLTGVAGRLEIVARLAEQAVHIELLVRMLAARACESSAAGVDQGANELHGDNERV